MREMDDAESDHAVELVAQGPRLTSEQVLDWGDSIDIKFRDGDRVVVRLGEA